MLPALQVPTRHHPLALEVEVRAVSWVGVAVRRVDRVSVGYWALENRVRHGGLLDVFDGYFFWAHHLLAL